MRQLALWAPIKDRIKVSLPQEIEKRVKWLYVFEQVIYAIACSVTSYIFAASRLQNHSIATADLIVTTAAIAIAVAEYARRWFRLIIGKTDLPGPNFAPAIIMALLWALLASLHHALLPVLACLCIMSAALFTLLDWLPKWVVQVWKESGLGISIPSAKRLSVMIPMIFTVIHAALFGGSVVLAVEGDWSILIMYLMLFIYLAFWRWTLFAEREKCEPGNIRFLALIAIFFLVYYCGYFGTNVTATPWMGNTFSKSFDMLAFSVFVGITVSIPGLTDLLQLQRQLVKESDFREKSRVLNVIAGAMTLVTYTAWVWLDFSHMFLLLFAMARAYWAHMVSYRRGESYKVSWIGPIISLATTTGLLCTELIGIWGNFNTIPIISGMMSGVKWYHTILAETIMLVFSNWKNFPKISLDQPVRDSFLQLARQIKAQEIHLCFLFLTSIVLELIGLLGKGNIDRIHFAMLVIFLDVFVILITSVVTFFRNLTISNKPQ